MSVKVRFRKLSDGTKTIYLDIYREGMKRQVESLPLRLTGNKHSDKEILLTAEAIRMKRELEFVQVSNGLKTAKVKDFNFIDLFKEIKNTKSKPTAKIWNNTLNYLIEYGGEKLSYGSIDKDFAREFKKFLLRKVGSPNTANIYFSKLKAALNQAVLDDLIPANPIAHIKNVSKVETHRANLTIDEVRALHATPCGNEEVKRAFLFGCYTGLRLCDIRAITGAKLHGNRLEFRQLKTKGVQYLDLSQQAIKILGRKIMPTEYAFNLPCHARVAIQVDNWAKRAGIQKKVTFHVSRHTFATLALTYGADLYTVSELLGHTDIKHTQIYAKIVDAKKSIAVEAIPTL